MRKTLLIAPILFLLFLASAENAFACSCSPDWTNKFLQLKVNGEFLGATSVFSGEVVEITRHPKYKYGVIVKVKVDSIWKAKPTEEIFIGTNRDSAACGYEFVVGKKYLVYAFGKFDDLTTSSCTRTANLENNKDIKFLDKVKILWEKKKLIKL